MAETSSSSPFAQGEDPGDARSGVERSRDHPKPDAGRRGRFPNQHEPRRPEAEGEAGRAYPRAGEGISPADDDPVRPPGAKAACRSLPGRAHGPGQGRALRPRSRRKGGRQPARATAARRAVRSSPARDEHPDRRRQGAPECPGSRRGADRQRSEGRRSRFRTTKASTCPTSWCRFRRLPTRTATTFSSRSTKGRIGSRYRSSSGRRMSQRHVR